MTNIKFVYYNEIFPTNIFMFKKGILLLASAAGISAQAQVVESSCAQLAQVYQKNIDTYLQNNAKETSQQSWIPSKNSGNSYDWITPSKDFERACNERWKNFTWKQIDTFMAGVRWRANFRIDGWMWYEIDNAVPKNLSEDETRAFRSGAWIMGVWY